MATIYHASDPLKSNTDFDGAETLVINYWGNILEEKIFPIPFWKIRQMLSASPSEQVAFHVTDFNNRSLVDATWEVYNEDLESLLAAQTTPHEYYFVMHENTFEHIRTSVPFGNPINQLMIWGRLGKVDAVGTDFVGLMMAAKGEKITLGSGGNGASTGVRLPPGGDQ